MKSRFLRMSIVMLLAVGLLAGNTLAKNSSKSTKASSPETGSYKGTIEVTKDKAGNVEKVTLKTGGVLKTTYNITLDDKGKELAEKMNGKRVHITGTLEKKSGGKWLVVKDYRMSHKATKAAKKSVKKSGKS